MNVSFPGLSVLHLPDALDHDFLPGFLTAEKPCITLCGDPSTWEQCIPCIKRSVCVGPNPPVWILQDRKDPQCNCQNMSKQRGAVKARCSDAVSRDPLSNFTFSDTVRELFLCHITFCSAGKRCVSNLDVKDFEINLEKFRASFAAYLNRACVSPSFTSSQIFEKWLPLPLSLPPSVSHPVIRLSKSSLIQVTNCWQIVSAWVSQITHLVKTSAACWRTVATDRFNLCGCEINPAVPSDLTEIQPVCADARCFGLLLRNSVCWPL